MKNRSNTMGRVSLVGAGPGDPELMTRKAWRCLLQADLVLVDALVDGRILAELPPRIRVVEVGKRGGACSTEQAFIERSMIAAARQGLHVVRLKGGDPFVFGRGGEELDALRAAGIETEVIQGLSAGLAGPAQAGIAATDRRCAPGVVLVTGYSGPGCREPDWSALARSGLTLVIYMGLARCAEIVQRLLAGGMDASCACAAIESACTASERTVFSTLAQLPDAVRSHGIHSPALLVIGDVVALGQQRAERLIRQATEQPEPPEEGAGKETLLRAALG